MNDRHGSPSSGEAARLRLSRRDVEALDFIVRFGFVSRMALMKRWGEDRAEVLKRTARLERIGLIDIREGEWDRDTLHSPTAPGTRRCERSALAAAPDAWAEHHAIVAELAACEERLGRRVVSARELGAMEASEAAGLCASLPSGGLRRADMVVLSRDGRPEAVEVEVVPRDAEQLEELMRAWAAAISSGRLGAVTWRCGRGALQGAEATVELTAASPLVAVRGLWQ